MLDIPSLGIKSTVISSSIHTSLELTCPCERAFSGSKSPLYCLAQSSGQVLKRFATICRQYTCRNFQFIKGVGHAPQTISTEITISNEHEERRNVFTK